jgi:hypothetical protein
MDTDAEFVLSPELTALRDQVGKIIREEIIPIEKRIDPDAAEIPEEDYWLIARKVQVAGMWCMGAPREYGGGGLGTFDMCVLTEEMAQHRMGLYNAGCGVFGRTPPPVIYAGTEEQKRTYAGGTIKNAWHTFFAITEPSAAPILPALSSAKRFARAILTSSTGQRFLFRTHMKRSGASSSPALIPRPAAKASPVSSSRRALRDLPRGHFARYERRRCPMKFTLKTASCQLSSVSDPKARG